nr:MAG TPA: PhnA Zinc-Ribbon [Caudoviricetes sp.]
MSETPKCPGCGADMELMHLCKAAFCYACTKCGWASPIGIDSESAFRMAMRRAEPKNRVLTLEEVRKAEKDTFDISIHWLELKFEPFKYEGKVTKCASYAAAMFLDESDDVLFSSVSMSEDYGLCQTEYGKRWRCWLRKPTEEEMEGTPWEI